MREVRPDGSKKALLGMFFLRKLAVEWSGVERRGEEKGGEERRGALLPKRVFGCVYFVASKGKQKRVRM